MTQEPLQGIRVCVFDAYGMISDFASTAARFTDALGGEGGGLTGLWAGQAAAIFLAARYRAGRPISGR
jgi:hypothetical protein